ncbi:MAG TPA: TonB-dependent receptor plug domain-containing protein, partial [Povalibacter sp.]|nr:TonB-dependent receptor plug domain-containing protein [Povalibacter sp.]
MNRSRNSLIESAVMHALRRGRPALLGAMLLPLGATVANAAEPAPALEEVVVTGIRASIENSIAVKRNDSSIVEAVSAEDIGKLPDSSIAESIARLPGIAAQRTNGRAQTLSIRGLGPDFTVTTFNGREQASTNDNRTVEFDQYPSELVQQVKIYKTPDAGMAYQGIAGTTDIQTVHPLAFSDRKLAFGYKREMD